METCLVLYHDECLVRDTHRDDRPYALIYRQMHALAGRARAVAEVPPERRHATILVRARGGVEHDRASFGRQVSGQQAATDSGGALGDSFDVALTVNAVNDAPAGADHLPFTRLITTGAPFFSEGAAMAISPFPIPPCPDAPAPATQQSPSQTAESFRKSSQCSTEYKAAAPSIRMI